MIISHRDCRGVINIMALSFQQLAGNNVDEVTMMGNEALYEVCPPRMITPTYGDLIRSSE